MIEEWRPVVSRLVCVAFHGAAPSPQHEVAHGDGCRTNDAESNLRWAAKLENAQDKVRHGRTTRGTAHRSVKLTEDQARQVKAMLAQGRSTTSIAKQFGVTYQSIQLIRKGRNWAWLDAA